MKIHIRQIRPEGIEQSEVIPMENIGLTRQDSIRFMSPVKVSACITKAEDELIADVTASGQYESSCLRCLEDVRRDWKTDFTLAVDVNKHTEFVELDEDIRQELILNLPARVLCNEGCKGLCIECGVNLNNQECEHKHAVVSGQ